MMKTWLGVLASTVLFVSNASAEGNVRSIPFVAKPGDSAMVSITHDRIDESASGNKTSKVELVYRAEIVGETEKGYKLTWHPVSVTANGQKIDTTTDQPAVEQDINLEFETDGAGMPKTLLNFSAVKENTLKALETSTPARSGDAVIKTRALLEKMSPEGAAGMFGKYALVIGFFQGFALEPGKPKAYNDQLPSPFGGGYVDTNASATLTSVDEAKDTARIEWQQSLDQISFKKFLVEFVKLAAIKSPSQSNLEALKFDTNYKATANVRLSDGWLTDVRYEFHTFADDGKSQLNRTERYTITVEK